MEPEDHHQNPRGDPIPLSAFSELCPLLSNYNIHRVRGMKIPIIRIQPAKFLDAAQQSFSFLLFPLVSFSFSSTVVLPSLLASM